MYIFICPAVLQCDTMRRVRKTDLEMNQRGCRTLPVNCEGAGTHKIINGLYTIRAAYGDSDSNSAAYDVLKAYDIPQVPPFGNGRNTGSEECMAACQNRGAYTGP